MRFSVYIGLIVVLLVVSLDVTAQCSMCRAVVENNESNIGQGLNNGILYLMAIPYALLFGGGIWLFKKQYSA